LAPDGKSTPVKFRKIFTAKAQRKATIKAFTYGGSEVNESNGMSHKHNQVVEEALDLTYEACLCLPLRLCVFAVRFNELEEGQEWHLNR
jgi:hypothetical protein